MCWRMMWTLSHDLTGCTFLNFLPCVSLRCEGVSSMPSQDPNYSLDGRFHTFTLPDDPSQSSLPEVTVR